MKVKKHLILVMTTLLLAGCLAGCGDSSSEQSDADNTKTENANVSEEAEYVGTFGKEVLYGNIGDYVGCEFDITMIYEAKDAEGKYVFEAVEKTAEGSTVGLFRVKDNTKEKSFADLSNYSSLDNLAVKMKVVLDEVVYYEVDNSGEISIEYEVSAKEATFLPLDSVDTKLARSGYFVKGNRINFKSGLSVYIADAGTTYKDGANCAYIEIEAVNNGTESTSLPNPDFYGDDYVLEREFFVDVDNINGLSLAPGRKIQGSYWASLDNSDYSVIEADLFGAIVMVQYATSDDDNTEISDTDTNLGTDVYGSYSCDNGVDAVIDGEVGIYTDTEESYISLAALYYDSNHYTAEIQGVLEMISENTYSVKDMITGTVELEVTFVDGGMDVKVTATESDEYKVLEGHYDMTSQLDFSEVG